MTGIEPFRGQVVRQSAADQVVAPPYDAMTGAQRQRFRADHPRSYLHVTRLAEDEPDVATVDNATLAQRGRAALDALVADDLFTSAGGPAFYVYRLVEGAHAQSGLVCALPIDYMARVARPHEAIQPARAALLAEHFDVVQAASSPVACAVRDDGSLERELSAATAASPVLDLTGEDGLQQTVWRVDDPASSARLVERLQDQALYIIDGHHRFAALQQLRAAGRPVPALAAIFPEQALRLVGFHRLLELPATFSAGQFLELIRRRFRVEKVASLATVASGEIAIAAAGEWHRVYFDERPMPGDALIRLGSLDPVVLEREILQSIVGAHGPVNITYTPDTEPFAIIVDQAEAQGRIPIFVAPVAIEDMMAVAEAGMIMPAKSTYFTPKVRSGIFLQRFGDATGGSYGL